MINNENTQSNNVKLEEIHIEDKPFEKINYKNINLNNNSSDRVNNLKNKLSIEISSDDHIERENKFDHEKFKVPEHLKKTFICSLTLFLIGSLLIGLGFIQDIANADPGKGITFWSLGGIIFIPGGYYSYQFYKAKKSKDDIERERILKEIPEL